MILASLSGIVAFQSKADSTAVPAFQAGDAYASSCVGKTGDTGSGSSVSIMAVGDIVLPDSAAKNNAAADPDGKYFQGVRDRLQGADFLFGNIEGALTSQTRSRKSTGTGTQFSFRMPPHYTRLLKETGFKALHVANNHSYDYGDEGFRETVANLRNAEIAPVGVPGEIEVREVKGLRIALLGFTYSKKFNTVQDLPVAVELVRKARAKADYVVVSFHAGAEGTAYAIHPNAEEVFLGESRGNLVEFSRTMISSGADVVIGHGPHVLRAVECYQGKPIIYSLGNFVGAGGLSNRKLNSASAILELNVSNDAKLTGIKLHPVVLDESKLPVIDAKAFSVHLVNTLGEKAAYPGDFMRFHAPVDSESEFRDWYKRSTGVETPRSGSAAPN